MNCPTCGSRINKEATFCPKCGTELKSADNFNIKGSNSEENKEITEDLLNPADPHSDTTVIKKKRRLDSRIVVLIISILLILSVLILNIVLVSNDIYLFSKLTNIPNINIGSKFLI